MVYRYIKAGLNSVYNLRKAPSKPHIAVMTLTFRCNSKCKMCNIWKSEKKRRIDAELTAEELTQVFKDPFFSELASISLSGGEPYLRDDLVDIVVGLSRSCKKLNTIVLSSNGFLTEDIISKTEKMLKRVDSKVQISVGISLDGIGSIHDFIRGVPNAYGMVMKTLGGLKKLKLKYPNLHPGFGSVVLPWNVGSLADLVGLADKMGLPKPQFWLPIVTRGLFENKETEDTIKLSREQMQQALDFFDGYQYNRDFYAFYAENLRKINHKKGKIVPCFWGHSIFFADAFGDVYPCQYLIGKKYFMGNVKKQPMDNIWFSEKSRRIRHMLRKEPACTNCMMNCRFFENTTLNLFPYVKFKVKKQFGLLERS